MGWDGAALTLLFSLSTAATVSLCCFGNGGGFESRLLCMSAWLGVSDGWPMCCWRCGSIVNVLLIAVEWDMEATCAENEARWCGRGRRAAIQTQRLKVGECYVKEAAMSAVRMLYQCYDGW